MSTTDVLAMPPAREAPTRNPSRKTFYRANELNTFTFTQDGETREGYLTFSSARLIRLAVRPQKTRSRQAFVVSQSIIIDDPEIGELKGDTKIPHDLFREERYKAWREDEMTPFRVNAQQWVQGQNYDLIMAYAEHLQANHDFVVVEEPETPEGSQRKTQDLLVARPRNSGQITNHRDRGVHLDGFEVSVNPDYEAGFNDFFTGLSEQQQRWESAVELEAEQQYQALQSLRQNWHYLGGVYHDNNSRTWWARPVDVGLVVVDGAELPLYRRQGAQVRAELFTKFLEEDEASTPATGSAALPVPPLPADSSYTQPDNA